MKHLRFDITLIDCGATCVVRGNSTLARAWLTSQHRRDALAIAWRDVHAMAMRALEAGFTLDVA